MQGEEALKVLIVGSEESYCDEIARLLQAGGCQTITEPDVSRALDVVRQHRPKIVATTFTDAFDNGSSIIFRLKAMDFHEPTVAVFDLTNALLPIRQIYHYGAELIVPPGCGASILRKELERVAQSLEQRWRKRPADPPEHRLGACVHTLEEALEQQVCVLGRGGMLLCGVEDAPPAGTRVAFGIKITEGALPRLEGTGTVRWSCTDLHTCTQAGLGIEFDFLQDSSRRAFLHRLKTRPCRPYIPCVCIRD